MLTSKLAAAAVVALLNVGLALAQGSPPILSPASIAGRSIRLGTDTVDTYNVRDGKRQLAGSFVNTTSRAQIDGRAVYLLASVFTSPRDSISAFDTLAVDATTYAPIWHRSRASTDSAAIAYQGRHASGWIDPSRSSRVNVEKRLSDATLEEKVVSSVLPLLPLFVGYETTITTFEPWEHVEKSTVFRVVGSEPLTWRGRPVDTWVVREIQGAGDRATRTRWIVKSTGAMIQTHDRLNRADIAATDGSWAIMR